MAKSAKERMREYRARWREQGRVPGADSQEKLNARRAAKRAAGLPYYDPQKKRAWNMVTGALRSGRMERQPCEKCGASPAEAHHDDYSRPLDVRWLCRTHHQEQHPRQRAA